MNFAASAYIDDREITDIHIKEGKVNNLKYYKILFNLTGPSNILQQGFKFLGAPGTVNYVWTV